VLAQLFPKLELRLRRASMMSAKLILAQSRRQARRICALSDDEAATKMIARIEEARAAGDLAE
jgi:hypothetical protein